MKSNTSNQWFLKSYSISSFWAIYIIYLSAISWDLGNQGAPQPSVTAQAYYDIDVVCMRWYNRLHSPSSIGLCTSNLVWCCMLMMITLKWAVGRSSVRRHGQQNLSRMGFYPMKNWWYSFIHTSIQPTTERSSHLVDDGFILELIKETVH